MELREEIQGGGQSECKEIAVRVSLKNNRLREARRARGLTVAALCAAAKVPRCEYYSIESFRRTARRANGTLRRAAERLCKFLELDPTIVFPLSLDVIEGGTREFQVNPAELGLLTTQLALAGGLGGWQPLDPETALALKEESEVALDFVSRRAARILAARAVNEPLDAIAHDLGVSRQTVLTGEQRALWQARKRIEASRRGIIPRRSQAKPPRERGR